MADKRAPAGPVPPAGGAGGLQGAIAAAERAVVTLLEGARDRQALGALKLEVAGKRGPLQPFYAGMKALAPDMRRQQGQWLKEAGERIRAAFEAAEARATANEDEALRRAGRADFTLPGRRPRLARPHPLRVVEQRVLDVLCGLGFQIAEGPLVEHDWYNFTALNMPADHPARDMQDTFFVDHDVVLRTHTSNVQVRTMAEHAPPLAVVAPGMVFRNDEIDATHTPMFHQVEGLWLDGSATFADLKGVLQVLLESLFGARSELRFRPSFFPFTEPSTEVDVSCSACAGRDAKARAACRLCKGTGFLEVLGAGMVDPAVLSAVALDPEQVQGFAFGIGLERLALLLYGVDDIRALYENEASFLEAFAARPLPPPPFVAPGTDHAR